MAYGDDNYDQFSDDSGSEAFGNLRKAHKALEKRIKEVESERDEATERASGFKAKVDATTVSEMLRTKGIDPGVSKFLKDVEPTTEALETWLAENGKLIGYDPSKGAGEKSDTEGEPSGEASEKSNETQESPEMTELRAQMARVQQAEANAAPGSSAGAKDLDAILRLGQNATSFEDVEKGLKGIGLL